MSEPVRTVSPQALDEWHRGPGAMTATASCGAQGTALAHGMDERPRTGAR